MHQPRLNVVVPLGRAAQSTMSDTEAAESLCPVVNAAPDDAPVTLGHMQAARDLHGGYMEDRTVRILEAAINGQPVAPIRPEDAELFERQRQLGWMPLRQACDELVHAVPQLQVVRTRAERLAPAREILDVSGDTVVVPGRLVNEAVGEADKLVGPDSTSADPLIRASLARMIVHRYITAVLASQRVDLTERAVWGHDQSRLSVRWSGSFFGPADPDASPG